MSNLEIKKAASDLAYTSITLNASDSDAAIAATAGQLQLTDAQYAGFKQSVNQFRQQYAGAAAQDTAQASREKQLAARAAAAAPAPKPAE